MDAQVVLLLQEEQNSVGDGADAQLEGVAVLDELGHVLADSTLHLGDPGGSQLDDGGVQLHQAADLGHVEEAVPQGAGHVPVHLGDDQVRGLRRALGVVHGHAQADIAVLVGGRALEHGHIGPQLLPQNAGDFGKIHGGKVHTPFGGRATGGAAQEKGVVVEVFIVFGLAVLCLAHGDHVDNLHISILGRVGHHGIQDGRGLAAGVGHHHTAAGLDLLHGLLGGAQMLLIPGLPIHGRHLLTLLRRTGPCRPSSATGPCPAGIRQRGGPGRPASAPGSGA